ncbi:MAG: 5'-nucleotidase C-terminal domain-containing protein [Fimbriimonadaceae bacterium]|nr:5'-nucleotidase C-terminal domain-containing protein [Chthonomonadaceae bacterium]MCO5298269.1 5'-nucleotidase C-terminal domain-containing protein [Fimbriimonadaceae bacterium]
MMRVWTLILGLAVGVALVSARVGDGPGTESHLPSQAAADLLRDATGADGAFLAAGLVKDTFQQDNLASLLQYPTDQVVLVQLTGAQIRQAFERTLSLYPLPNTSFLQISGFEVEFSKTADAGSRVTSVTASGSKLEDEKTYSVAMPSSLGRGGLGYFKIWDKSKITKTFENMTVESVLKGKRYVETEPRWVGSSPF